MTSPPQSPHVYVQSAVLFTEYLTFLFSPNSQPNHKPLTVNPSRPLPQIPINTRYETPNYPNSNKDSNDDLAEYMKLQHNVGTGNLNKKYSLVSYI